MRRSRLQLATAGVFFALTGAIVFGSYGLVDRMARVSPHDSFPQAAIQPQAGGRMVVARRLLARGSTLAAEDLTVIETAGAPPTDAVTNPAEAIGRVTRVDILAGQTVMAAGLALRKEGGGLAALVPEGMRAVAVRINDEIAVGNHLRPGDVADLHAILHDKTLPQAENGPTGGREGDRSEARILLQNVVVLSVGDAFSPLADDKDAAAKRREVRDLTLAVTPDQASQLALLRNVAAYTLSLRNGLDRAVVADRTVRLADLRGESAGRPPASQAPSAGAVRRAAAIQVLNGTQLTTMRPGGGR